MTNLRPDQTALIAHTFTSTRPAASPISRTLFSSRSVASPELFLGQETHSIPAGASLFDHCGNFFLRSDWLLLGSNTKSRAVLTELASWHSVSAVLSSDFTSGGRSGRATLKPGLIPSFFGSGVPEYPAIAGYLAGA